MKENKRTANSRNELGKQTSTIPKQMELTLTNRREPLLGVSRAAQTRNVAALLQTAKTLRGSRTQVSVRHPKVPANPSPLPPKPVKYTPSSIFKAYIREALHAVPTETLKPIPSPLTAHLATNGEGEKGHKSPSKAHVRPLIHTQKRAKEKSAPHATQSARNGSVDISISISIPFSEEHKLDRTMQVSVRAERSLAAKDVAQEWDRTRQAEG
jgi:hypothetical protein